MIRISSLAVCGHVAKLEISIHTIASKLATYSIAPVERHAAFDRMSSMRLQITDLCLKVLAENPSLYTDLKNATLVQNMNGQESIASILEVSAFDRISSMQPASHYHVLSPCFYTAASATHDNLSISFFCSQALPGCPELYMPAGLSLTRKLPSLSCHCLLQVLRPIQKLLDLPEVYSSPQLSREARKALHEAYQPMIRLLEQSVHGNSSGEIFRRLYSPASMQQTHLCTLCSDGLHTS